MFIFGVIISLCLSKNYFFKQIHNEICKVKNMISGIRIFLKYIINNNNKS